MGRKTPRKRLARCVISAFTRVFDAIACAQRVSRKHPNVSRRSAHPSMGVSEAKMQNPGRRKCAAGTRRCVLFEIAAVLWKPHPEEARSPVSKDEARDPLPSCFETPRVCAAPQHEGGRGYASRPRRVRSLFSPVIYRETAPHASCAGLTRASILFARNFYEAGWIAGSSPAMTRSFARHARASRAGRRA